MRTSTERRQYTCVAPGWLDAIRAADKFEITVSHERSLCERLFSIEMDWHRHRLFDAVIEEGYQHGVKPDECSRHARENGMVIRYYDPQPLCRGEYVAVVRTRRFGQPLGVGGATSPGDPCTGLVDCDGNLTAGRYRDSSEIEGRRKWRAATDSLGMAEPDRHVLNHTE